MEEFKTIPMRRFFVLLALVAGTEWLLMVTVNAALEQAQYPTWLRAIVDAGLLAVICVPFMLNYQLRPLRAAYYDELTGLPNRQLFRDRLRHALAGAKRMRCNCAVVFIDLDDFKPVNDVHGHRVGDELLKHAARRLLNSVRESDTVARIGGDEFTILLPDVREAADAEKVVQKVIAAFTRPFVFDDSRFQVGISAGIALYPRDGEEVYTLIDAADGAMYRAKNQAGSNYCLVEH